MSNDKTHNQQTKTHNQRMRYDHTPAYAAYLEAVKASDDIKAASKAFIDSLDSDDRERIETLYHEVTYTRRRYPGNLMYCWALHPLFTAAPLDPWPAARYPKVVVMADLAIRDAAAREMCD